MSLFAELSGIFTAAQALWRRDRAILMPVAALFVFLPQYALLLIVPPIPAAGEGTTVEAFAKLLEPWIASYGGWYVGATALAQFGVLALVSLYAGPALAAGGALVRAARLFPRALLAGLLVTFPCGSALLLALSVPLLAVAVLPGVVYVLARSTLANPVILNERGVGAAGAIVRSWRLTRGRGLLLTLLVGAITIGGQVLGAVVVSFDRGIRAGPFANPVLLAMIDALAAGIAGAAALLLALVQVVLYRRLAR